VESPAGWKLIFIDEFLQAVAVSPVMEYAIVERKGDPRLLVVAVDRLEPLKEALGEMTVLGKLSGASAARE
jgi:hypothetical protein